MRVLFLVEGRSTPSSRLRVAAHVPALRREGIVAEIADIPRSPVARAARFLRLGRYDAVVLQKKLLRAWELALVARRAPRLVYDFDDAVTIGPRGTQEDPARAARLAATVARCDAVIAGNEELAAYVAGHPAVHVIPTGVDPDGYQVKAPGTADGRTAPVVIGWIGTRGNLRYLETLDPVLRGLAAGGLRVTLRVIADDVPRGMGVPVECLPWRLDREAADLAGFDIGVMPLDDTAWTRGKCGFKLLQYMAAGLPTVASPVGVNRSIIRDGDNGLLADTPEAWVAALARLITDPALRARVGREARRTVQERYSLARCSAAVVDVLRKLCDAVPGSPGAPSAPASTEPVNA